MQKRVIAQRDYLVVVKGKHKGEVVRAVKSCSSLFGAEGIYVLRYNGAQFCIDVDSLAPMPMVGDLVQVSDQERCKGGITKVYLGYIPEQTTHPIIAKSDGGTGEYATAWKYMLPIKQKPSIDITVKVNGKEVSPKALSDETWRSIREGRE